MNKTEKTKEEKKIKEYKNRQQETKKEKRERRKLRRKESRKLMKFEQEKKNDDKNLEKILFLHKEIGETPLQVLDNFKKDNKNYSDIKMAYAGRLDPLASGKLLVLVGNECKKRDKYLSLDKEYIFEILLDFKSDSQDVLGIPIFSDKSHQKTKENIIKIKDKKFFKKIDNEIKNKFLGKKSLKYPIYSSKAVLGKPLFLWSLEGRINEIEIPKKDVQIYKIDLISKKEILKKDLHQKIFENIGSIKKVTETSKELGNDFRREEIKKEWNNIFSKINNEEKFLILKIKIRSSSGTYMRTLSEKIAKEIFDSYGLAFSIERTRMGKNYKKYFWNFFRDLK